MVKVERSSTVPASLKREYMKINGSYSQQDVVEQLKKDFHNKCYICELGELQDPQIEHRLPHFEGKFKERKFDWNNLFWVCGHCNRVKNQRKYDMGILDCCKEDPEERMLFILGAGDAMAEAKDVTDKEAVLTAELITEVFNLKNTGMRIEAVKIRCCRLMEEMNALYNTLEKIRKNPRSKVTERKLRALLRRESAFAAFKRCYAREYGFAEYM